MEGRCNPRVPSSHTGRHGPDPLERWCSRFGFVPRVSDRPHAQRRVAVSCRPVDPSGFALTVCMPSTPTDVTTDGRDAITRHCAPCRFERCYGGWSSISRNRLCSRRPPHLRSHTGMPSPQASCGIRMRIVMEARNSGPVRQGRAEVSLPRRGPFILRDKDPPVSGLGFG